MPEPEATLRVAADPRNLERIRHFVRTAAEAAGAPSAAAWDLVQAVDESATNVIVHGYRGGPGEVEIRVRTRPDEVVVRIIDAAPTFDPTTLPSPDLDLPLDRRPLGKMGVHLARELADEVRHRGPTAGPGSGRSGARTGNELTLIKRFAANGGRPSPVEQEAR